MARWEARCCLNWRRWLRSYNPHLPALTAPRCSMSPRSTSTSNQFTVHDVMWMNSTFKCLIWNLYIILIIRNRYDSFHTRERSLISYHRRSIPPLAVEHLHCIPPENYKVGPRGTNVSKQHSCFGCPDNSKSTRSCVCSPSTFRCDKCYIFHVSFNASILRKMKKKKVTDASS